MTTTMTTKTHTQLGAAPFDFGFPSLVLGDIDNIDPTGVMEQATTDMNMDAAAAAATAAAFTDQIDYFGDPTVRTLVLVFGGVIFVLGGLALISQTMNAAIENVLVDFETVMTDDAASSEFRGVWKNDIESKLKVYDEEVEKARMRKQKLFEIMEELEATKPDLMKRVNVKMAALTSNNKQ